MRIRVNRARGAFSVLSFWFLFVAFPASTVAETVAESDERDRWVPALSIHSGALFEDSSATSTTGPVLGPRIPNSPQPIRPRASSTKLLITPLVGGGFELMSPRVAKVAFAPRFFAHGGVTGAFGPERDVAKERTIARLNIDPELDVLLPESAVQGQGSVVRVTVEQLLVRAGLGVALPFELQGRSFRLRASAEYLREEIRVEGHVRRAVCLVVPTSPGTCGARNPDALDDFRQVDLRRTRNEFYHGIGPGLELEMDAGRMGAVLTSVAIGAQAYRFFGDREISFSAINQFGETADFRYEKDAWAYQAGVGFRLRWAPE